MEKEGEEREGRKEGGSRKASVGNAGGLSPAGPPWSLTETGRSWVTALAMPPVGNMALD